MATLLSSYNVFNVHGTACAGLTAKFVAQDPMRQLVADIGSFGYPKRQIEALSKTINILDNRKLEMAQDFATVSTGDGFGRFY